MKNISEFLSENVQFLVLKISIYLDRRVFVMVWPVRSYGELILTLRCFDIEWEKETRSFGMR